MKVLIKGDDTVERAYAEYKKFCRNKKMREIDDARQRYMHDYATDVADAYVQGETNGGIKLILAMLKDNLKKRIPKRIVDALQTRTDPKELESLLFKAAKCQSLEDFEKELS